jgi:hypothetical protein
VLIIWRESDAEYDVTLSTRGNFGRANGQTARGKSGKGKETQLVSVFKLASQIYLSRDPQPHRLRGIQLLP